MDDPNNPYLSPNISNSASLTPLEGEDPRTIGKARQVRVVAILMIVHGVLMVIACCIMIGVAFYMAPEVAKQIKLQQGTNPKAPQLSPEVMQNILYATYGGMALALLAVAVINIIAGIMNLGYRGRVFGIISMIASLGSILFCYCMPLSIGLLIYGLIIYLSPEAEQAFRWRASTSH